MSIPMWVLLAFAGWTIAVLLTTVGVYRWSRILTGRVPISAWRADDLGGGSEWYRRAMRAHMNCVENLPVYGAVAVAAYASGAQSPLLDQLALVFLAARVCQSVIHLALTQTNAIAAIRFGFFFIQLACMIAMGVLVAQSAAG